MSYREAVARSTHGNRRGRAVKTHRSTPDHHQKRGLKMATNTVIKKALSASQIGFVLNDIAMSAKAIKRYSVMLNDEGDPRDISALVHGVCTMAERIGLLADRAANEYPGTLGAVFGATVEEWMLPPAYDEKTEAE
jgi:hypothetical protein